MADHWRRPVASHGARLTGLRGEAETLDTETATGAHSAQPLRNKEPESNTPPRRAAAVLQWPAASAIFGFRSRPGDFKSQGLNDCRSFRSAIEERLQLQTRHA